MAQDYYAILTNAGLAYEAQQKAQNRPITLTTMAIGDGNGAAYNPDPAAIALRREVHRQPLNALLQDANNPTWLVCEAWLADNVGGWTIREVGVYTDTGILYAIAKYPESVKPLLASGSGKQFYVRSIFQTSNAGNVTLLVDNAVVMATRAFVMDYVRDELAKQDDKQSVRVATTANIVLSGLQNIDGVDLVAGDRVLVKDQAAAKENGIYVVAAGIWTRAADADNAAKLNAGAVVPVTEGTLSADTIWTLRTDGVIVIGTTALAFQWLAGANAPNQPAADNSAKVANTAFVNGAVAAVASGHMFEISQWMGTREAIAQGWFAMDGVQISELLVPGIRDAITASGQSIVTEAVWQADPLKRGAWSSGAAGWVRMPDWNGVQASSIGGLYFGGDLGGGRRGTVVSDAIRNILGTSFRNVAATAVAEQFQVSGPFVGSEFYEKYPELAAIQNTTVAGGAYPRSITFDASRVVPTAAENRPKTVYGTWIMRLYGSITNVGGLDAPALVARMGALEARVSLLEAVPKPLGHQQTWTNVTAARALATIYTNTTGRTIEVSVSASATGSGAALAGRVAGADVISGTYCYNGNAPTSVCLTVPAGATYEVRVGSGSANLTLWQELR